MGRSTAEKNELLFSRGGTNFNALPSWQKRGIGVFWEDYEKSGLNPKTGEVVTAERRKLHRELELPMREEYEDFVRSLLVQAHDPTHENGTP